MGHARPQAAPSVFGRYETLFRIASGGMAEVYAARVRGEAGFQKLVALKRMLPHLTDDERFVNMFMDEGKLAANISSPNVVSTLDLGRADDDSLYLVMELVVGTTLSTLLRNAAKHGESIPIDVAVELMAQAAQGLHDAHEARTPFGAPLHIVHRDVSPQNILLGTDGRVRITDFGVARAILRRTKTSTGEFKGKLSYFSPEQCADQGVDRRSDIFSLGVVAWETLTTRRLFHAENPLAVLERVTRMPIPSAHTVRPEIPTSVAAVVANALERNADTRFSTAADFAQALRAAARDTVGVADRHRIAELVQQYGGETLERVQVQLKESLATTAPAIEEDIDEAKTEISSGIVFREDGAPGPATPRAQPEATPAPAARPSGSFVEDPRAAPASPERSKAPVVIASIVALLGLGAGAVIGIMASTPDDPMPGTIEVTSEALPTSATAPDEASAEGADDDATDEATDDATEESGAEPQRAAADSDEAEAPEDDEESETAADRRRARRLRDRQRRRSTAELPTSVTPDPEPDPEPRVRPEPRRRPTPRAAPEPQPEPDAPRRRPGNLMGIDDFNNLGR